MPTVKPFYQLSSLETLKKLNTTLQGLRVETVPLLQKQFGVNILPEPKQKSRLTIYYSLLSSQFFRNRSLWLAIHLTVLLQMGLVYLPIANPIFKTIALSGSAILNIISVTVVCIVCIDLLKILFKKIFEVIIFRGSNLLFIKRNRKII